MYTIGEFAKLVKRSVITLQRWDREGRLVAHRTQTGRRYYTEQQLLEYRGLLPTDNAKIVAYARISSVGQKQDLKSQKDFINEFALNSGLPIDEWVEDIGSGLDYNRKGFNKLLSLVENGEIKKVIIAHKDRFVRFGYEWFENFCLKHGCEILVINTEKLSPQVEMIQDLISIIHVFSCRIYGLRTYKDKIKKDTSLSESL